MSATATADDLRQHSAAATVESAAVPGCRHTLLLLGPLNPAAGAHLLCLFVPNCVRRQPWSVYELKVPADGGKRAREWAEKLQMNTLRFFLDQFLDRLADKA